MTAHLATIQTCDGAEQEGLMNSPQEFWLSHCPCSQLQFLTSLANVPQAKAKPIGSQKSQSCEVHASYQPMLNYGNQDYWNCHCLVMWSHDTAFYNPIT